MTAGSTRHLVLVGMMGTGKSAVGRVCAQRLGRRFIDLDEQIETEAGLAIPELFERHGEPAFRERERDAVRAAAGAAEPTVIACGGGAVLDAGNREALRRGGVVIWLDAPPAVLAARVESGEGRPLLTGTEPVERRLAGLAEERRGAYRDAAHARVDASGGSVDEVATEALARYDEFEQGVAACGP